MRLIMDIPVSVVSTAHEWFNKSAEKIDDFENYFVWQETPSNGVIFSLYSRETYITISHYCMVKEFPKTQKWSVLSHMGKSVELCTTELAISAGTRGYG